LIDKQSGRDLSCSPELEAVDYRVKIVRPRVAFVVWRDWLNGKIKTAGSR
jgi:hypothetical protein